MKIYNYFSWLITYKKMPLFKRSYFLYIVYTLLVFSACKRNDVDKDLQEYLLAVDSISQQKPKEGLRKIDSLLEKKQNSKNQKVVDLEE